MFFMLGKKKVIQDDNKIKIPLAIENIILLLLAIS